MLFHIHFSSSRTHRLVMCPPMSFPLHHDRVMFPADVTYSARGPSNPTLSPSRWLTTHRNLCDSVPGAAPHHWQQNITISTTWPATEMGLCLVLKMRHLVAACVCHPHPISIQWVCGSPRSCQLSLSPRHPCLSVIHSCSLQGGHPQAPVFPQFNHPQATQMSL